MAQSKVEKIASIEQEIKQLKERQKQLQQQHNLQERKDRTKRLCKRAGLLESMLPDTIPLTDEQFKTFLEKTVLTDMASKILAEIASNPIPSIPSRPTEAEQSGGLAQEQDEDDTTRVTG